MIGAWRPCALAVALLALLTVPSVAQAPSLDGIPHGAVSRFSEPQVTGNTLMVYNKRQQGADPRRSVGTVVDVPQGATVEAAYLFWTGTYDQTPDRNVDFTLPNEAVLNDLSVSKLTGRGPAVVQGKLHLSNGATFALADSSTSTSTSSIAGETHTLHEGLGANISSDYRVSDVKPFRAIPQDGQSYGTNDNRCADSNQLEQRLRFGCQTMYAGWSMVVIWSHPDERVRRNITVNDGFLLMDDDQTSAGITEVTMQNFQVPEGASGEFSFFGLEGDPDYGSIQALLPPGPSRCVNCPDFVAMRTSESERDAAFSEPGNSVGNLWNGSIMTVGGGVSPGVDIDVYDVGTEARDPA